MILFAQAKRYAEFCSVSNLEFAILHVNDPLGVLTVTPVGVGVVVTHVAVVHVVVGDTGNDEDHPPPPPPHQTVGKVGQL